MTFWEPTNKISEENDLVRDLESIYALVVFSWKKTCSVFFFKKHVFFFFKTLLKKNKGKNFFFQNHLFSR